MVAAQFNVRQLQRVADHRCNIRHASVGFAAFDERANALNDLARPVSLPAGFVQGDEQLFGADGLTLDARDHAIAVVVDGRQRLIQFMRHAGGHFAHRDQPAG